MSKCLGKIPAEWHYSPPGAAGFHFCVFITWIRGSSTVPTLLIQRVQAAMHPEGFLVPAIPLFTFLCKPGCLSHLPLSGKPPTRLEYFLISSQICPPVLGRFPRSPFPSRQETLKLPNSSANSSTLNSCWHFSLSLTLGTVSRSKESLFLNLHLLESKWDILYFH